MMIQTLSTPSGEKLVVMPLADYEELIDAQLHSSAMRDVDAKRVETFSSEQAAQYVAASSPLHFWREHRGFSVPALAERAALPEAQLRAVETGEATLDVQAYGRLASCLRVRIEDLIEEM